MPASGALLPHFGCTVECILRIVCQLVGRALTPRCAAKRESSGGCGLSTGGPSACQLHQRAERGWVAVAHSLHVAVAHSLHGMAHEALLKLARHRLRRLRCLDSPPAGCPPILAWPAAGPWSPTTSGPRRSPEGRFSAGGPGAHTPAQSPRLRALLPRGQPASGRGTPPAPQALPCTLHFLYPCVI